ncbi:fibrinolytic enzyme, isozyme C-like [Trichogramma pretiosum]|uniref:fibrinolytic enzyme, isozyme C-like n=1 Tax=Trichogramma pretiosum TaxID=7493 RepID=UPI0006C9A01B|nr:fibrinolytic enzyme, isozyme C-like [Trichogramma pretiosum]
MYESKFRPLCLLLLTLNLPRFLCLEGEHIIGGEEAHPGQFNYHVAIEYSDLCYQPYICGGAIIDDRHVITAAHCFVEDDRSGFRPQRTRIVAGVSDLEDRRGAVLRGVAKVYVPERYFRAEAASAADIAVLQLEAPIGLGNASGIGAIRPPANRKSYAGHLAVLTGFGTTSVAIHENARGERHEVTGQYSPRLRYAPADVLTNEDCSRIKKQLVPRSLVCAKMRRRRAPDSRQPTGACSGDSGSPLVLGRSTLIGILVRSPFGCSELEAPAVYTRVSEFKTFIRLATKDVTSARIRTHRYV